MSLRFFLGIVMLFTILAICGWELYTFMFEPTATISVFMTDISEFSPWFMVFFSNLLGMLQGHFFIPARGSGRRGL